MPATVTEVPAKAVGSGVPAACSVEAARLSPKIVKIAPPTTSASFFHVPANDAPFTTPFGRIAGR
jgi:hypothetical protein